MFRGDLSTPRARARAWSDSLLVDHAAFRVLWDNWAAVVPGRLYRCNHPTPARLARATRRHGIKTLINLRGHRRVRLRRALARGGSALGLVHIDAPFESRGAPHKDRILRLAEIYRTMAEPALIHCKSGADRAGLASGLFILLDGGTAREALAQLSWRFGHFNRSRTGILDAFFVRYAMEGEGRKPFLDWLREDYDEMALRRDFVAGGLASFVNDRLLARE